MRLSRLEKKTIVFTLILALFLCFIPTTGVDAATEETQTLSHSYKNDLVGNGYGDDYNRNYTVFPKGTVEKTSGKYKYKLDDAGNAVLTGYTGTDATVTVPSEIDGYKVVSLYTTFHDNSTVKNVVLPATVTKIEYGAFWNATNLQSVNLENIKYMGWGYDWSGENFSGCKKLGDFVLPENVAVDGSQFYESKVKSITIPAKLYWDYLSLGSFETEEIRFASGITKLSMYFGGMTVPELIIPDSVTDISQCGFNGIDTDRIVIGKGVKTVSPYQFSYFGFHDDRDFELQLGINTELIEYEAFQSARLSSLVIPDKVTEIQYEAFSWSDIPNLTFSKNLTRIMGGYAGAMDGSVWYDNQNDGVVYTGGALYSYKGSVPKNTAIKVKSGTKGIAYRAFQTKDGSNANITSVALPDGLTYIGGVAFFNTGITNIQIPNTVTEISAGAFGNTGLKSVTIPKSVKKIGDYAFGYESAEMKNSKEVWIYDDLFEPVDNWWWTAADFFGNGGPKSEYYIVYAPTKVSGFTIYGYPGTAAETYAKENGFTFVDVSGQEESGWKTVDGKKYYYENGTFVTGGKKIDGKVYYFNKYGVMKTGFVKVKGNYYYLSPQDGSMQTGVQQIDGKTYYFNKEGIMQTGVLKTSKGIFYLDPTTGAMHTGWLTYETKEYYFADDGKMVTGWYKIGKNYYGFNKKGQMVTGWILYKDNMYYAREDGTVAINCTIEIGGKNYTFNKKGICLNAD